MINRQNNNAVSNIEKLAYEVTKVENMTQSFNECSKLIRAYQKAKKAYSDAKSEWEAANEGNFDEQDVAMQDTQITLYDKIKNEEDWYNDPKLLDYVRQIDNELPREALTKKRKRKLKTELSAWQEKYVPAFLHAVKEGGDNRSICDNALNLSLTPAESSDKEYQFKTRKDPRFKSILGTLHRQGRVGRRFEKVKSENGSRDGQKPIYYSLDAQQQAA